MYISTLTGQIIYTAYSAISQLYLRLNPEAIVFGKAFAIFCTQAIAISFIITATNAVNSVKFIVHTSVFSNQINEAAIIA